MYGSQDYTVSEGRTTIFYTESHQSQGRAEGRGKGEGREEGGRGGEVGGRLLKSQQEPLSLAALQGSEFIGCECVEVQNKKYCALASRRQVEGPVHTRKMQLQETT